MHESPKHKSTFGYLSAVHTAEHGYFGGLLIVSPLGRPIEFHCTSPVLPSRAQQILYGPTLEPFLLGEQIGSSLIAAIKLAPCLILTDFAQFEAIKDLVKVPLVLMPGDALPTAATLTDKTKLVAAASTSGSVDRDFGGHPAWCRPFAAGKNQLQLPIGMESQIGVATELIALLSERVELSEPFERIHEAIREAQRIGARGAESHAQAA